MKHEQIELNGIQIDKGLEDLMATLWCQGITTYNSCIENTLNENGEVTTWLEVELNDWQKLVSRAFHTDKDLYYWIEEFCKVELLCTDDGMPDPEDDDQWIEGDYLVWSASVRFPRKLLDQAALAFTPSA